MSLANISFTFTFITNPCKEILKNKIENSKTKHEIEKKKLKSKWVRSLMRTFRIENDKLN